MDILQVIIHIRCYLGKVIKFKALDQQFGFQISQKVMDFLMYALLIVYFRYVGIFKSVISIDSYA